MLQAEADRALHVEAVAPTDPALAPLWRRLQDRGGVGTPFLSWEWFSAFAEEPELAAHCRVLVVRRSGGRAMGLFPVVLTPAPGRLCVLRCAGTDALGADHLDVVAAPADRDDAAAAVARYVARSLRWDLADLDGLAGDGALARSLERELRLPRCLPRRSEGETAPVISLRGPGSEEVLARLRRRSSRGTKSAERAGGGYSVVVDPAEAGAALESLMQLHNDRFGDRSVVFSTPALRRFHVRAVTRLAGAGLARVSRLSTGTADTALEYVLLLGDRAYSYQSGFDPDGGHSPGMTVLCRSVLTAAEDGLAEYDLLRGDEGYKADFATGVRPDARIRAVRPTPAAVAWVARQALARVRALRRGSTSAPRG